jgi:hypothetical protein
MAANLPDLPCYAQLPNLEIQESQSLAPGLFLPRVRASTSPLAGLDILPQGTLDGTQ